jgi:hypothetical protein
MDPEGVAMLGGPDWHKAYKRVTGVRHVSHNDVQQGKTDICYTEVLPADGGPVHLQGLNMDAEDGPAAEAGAAPDTIGTIVYINHNNDLGVLHVDDGKFVAVEGREGVPVHEPFSDLFSAQVYVDAQPKTQDFLVTEASNRIMQENKDVLERLATGASPLLEQDESSQQETQKQPTEQDADGSTKQDATEETTQQ